MIYTSKDIDLALLKEALFNLAESYNALNNNHLELKTRIALKNILDENENEDLELIYINSKELASINIIIPPLSLQQAFAAKVEAIEAIKAKVRQSLKEAETLFNERMDYYFN